MNTKLHIKMIGLCGVVLVIMACAVGTPAEQSPTNGVGTLVAETMQALTTGSTQSVPTESMPTQSAGTPFLFKNISFVIPNGMANGVTAEVVPAVSEAQGGPWWDIAPEYISITLSGYSTKNENEALTTFIRVYPAQEFMSANQGAAGSIPKLQAILANPSTPINMDTAPEVPTFNAAPMIVAQAGIVDFQNGSGVRTVTHYAQFSSPIVQNGQFYHYQGLTGDGKYYIVALFPILSPLQSTSATPSADGITFPDISTTTDETAFKAYYQAMTEKLNAADPNSFQPAIGELDALVQSIQVTP